MDAPPGDRPSRPAPPPDALPPLTFTRTAWPGAAAGRPPRSEPPRRWGRFTAVQWAGIVVVVGGGLLVAAFFAVVIAQVAVSLEPVEEFLARFPGEYPPPDAGGLGFPAWVGWQHFLNAFLLALIVKTGVQLRGEKRPARTLQPKWNRKKRMSLTAWFHQAVDVFWVANGVVYVVVLFVSGRWVRIVPTSWEVFPNAVSALLQYVSLDWPTAHSWANYNSLQQLSYFAVIFLATPVAIVTGIRLSTAWPRKSERLNRLFPFEWAKRLHYPTMLFFLAFIAVHVALVFATGALRNLNHVYSGTDQENWVGFWIFAASSAVIAAGLIAARPALVVPLARLFGTVKG